MHANGFRFFILLWHTSSDQLISNPVVESIFLTNK